MAKIFDEVRFNIEILSEYPESEFHGLAFDALILELKIDYT